MGVPSTADGATHWNPPSWLHRLTSGRHLLLWDEFPQAVPMMQNAIAGLLLDRFLGDVTLGPEVYQIATGNRTVDKAGANRVLGQVANRWIHLEMDAHLDDWCDWAFDNGIDPMAIAFLRYRPNLLSDYNPDRHSNPTPRAWERVNMIPRTLPEHQYFGMVAGTVGEGAAAEFVAFHKVASQLPDFKSILANPEEVPVPTDAAAKYAITTSLSTQTNAKNVETVVKYVTRMSPEFHVLYFKDCVRIDKEIMRTKAFTQWAEKNSSVLVDN